MMMATATAVAIVVYSCGSRTKSQPFDFTQIPLQTVDDMFFVQTENGEIQMRVEAGVMQRYDTDTSSFELFPKGLRVFAYDDEGLLETTIVSENARHHKSKNTAYEVWAAFGNVVIRNEKKSETIETDTIYWNRDKQEIYTDCYVRLYSPQGLMQGYGMRSDEKARNAVINRPFDTYGIVKEDSTKVVIDTANFIGPLLKNNGK